jgi:hypothetical protein
MWTEYTIERLFDAFRRDMDDQGFKNLVEIDSQIHLLDAFLTFNLDFVTPGRFE